MPIAFCRICKKDFYIKPNRLIRGWGKYCSNACKHLGLKAGNEQSCSNCGVPTYRANNDQAKSKEGRFFCSKSCQAKWRNSKVFFGENHGNWKGGRSSYRTILKRTKAPQVCSKCRTTDIRILAVHHKDRNRQNNLPINLIWLCHNCHYLVHHHAEESAGFLTA